MLTGRRYLWMCRGRCPHSAQVCPAADHVYQFMNPGSPQVRTGTSPSRPGCSADGRPYFNVPIKLPQWRPLIRRDVRCGVPLTSSMATALLPATRQVCGHSPEPVETGAQQLSTAWTAPHCWESQAHSGLSSSPLFAWGGTLQLDSVRSSRKCCPLAQHRPVSQWSARGHCPGDDRICSFHTIPE